MSASKCSDLFGCFPAAYPAALPSHHLQPSGRPGRPWRYGGSDHDGHGCLHGCVAGPPPTPPPSSATTAGPIAGQSAPVAAARRDGMAPVIAGCVAGCAMAYRWLVLLLVLLLLHLHGQRSPCEPRPRGQHEGVRVDGDAPVVHPTGAPFRPGLFAAHLPTTKIHTHPNPHPTRVPCSAWMPLVSGLAGC